MNLRGRHARVCVCRASRARRLLVGRQAGSVRQGHSWSTPKNSGAGSALLVLQLVGDELLDLDDHARPHLVGPHQLVELRGQHSRHPHLPVAHGQPEALAAAVAATLRLHRLDACAGRACACAECRRRSLGAAGTTHTASGREPATTSSPAGRVCAGGRRAAQRVRLCCRVILSRTVHEPGAGFVSRAAQLACHRRLPACTVKAHLCTAGWAALVHYRRRWPLRPRR